MKNAERSNRVGPLGIGAEETKREGLRQSASSITTYLIKLPVAERNPLRRPATGKIPASVRNQN